MIQTVKYFFLSVTQDIRKQQNEVIHSIWLERILKVFLLGATYFFSFSAKQDWEDFTKWMSVVWNLVPIRNCLDLDLIEFCEIKKNVFAVRQSKKLGKVCIKG